MSSVYLHIKLITIRNDTKSAVGTNETILLIET